MDALIGELQHRLGTPGEGIVDFYYVAAQTDGTPLRDYCESADSGGLLACTNDRQEVFSRAIPHEHELVHAVDAEVGFSQTFLEEGLAEFLGDDGRMAGRGEPTGSVADAIASVTRGNLPLGYYGVAGHFVSFLEGRLGTGELIERIDAVDFEASADDVEAALAMGVRGGFPALEQQYEATPKCARASYRDAESMCNVAAPLFDRCSPDEDTIVDVAIDRASEDVLGPREEEIWAYRTFEIVNSGVYRVLAVRGGAVYLPEGLEIKPCGGGCDSPPISIEVFDEQELFASDTDVDLETGRYLMRVTRPVSDPASVRIQFRGDGCE